MLIANKYYIAGPFFNDIDRERMNRLKEYLLKIDDNSERFFFPMDHFIDGADKLPNYEWSRKVFKADVDALKSSDAIIAIYDGHYSDSGTAWEIGLGYALQKPVILLVVDSNVDLSLMPLCSCNQVYDFETFLHNGFPIRRSSLTTLK